MENSDEYDDITDTSSNYSDEESSQSTVPIAELLRQTHDLAPEIKRNIRQPRLLKVN